MVFTKVKKKIMLSPSFDTNQKYVGDIELKMVNGTKAYECKSEYEKIYNELFYLA